MNPTITAQLSYRPLKAVQQAEPIPQLPENPTEETNVIPLEQSPFVPREPQKFEVDEDAAPILINLETRFLNQELLDELRQLDASIFDIRLAARKFIELADMTDAEIIQSEGEEMFKISKSLIYSIRGGANFKDIAEIIRRQSAANLQRNDYKRVQFLQKIVNPKQLQTKDKELIFQPFVIFADIPEGATEEERAAAIKTALDRMETECIFWQKQVNMLEVRQIVDEIFRVVC